MSLSSLRRNFKGGSADYRRFIEERNDWVSAQMVPMGMGNPPRWEGEYFKPEPEQQARLDAVANNEPAYLEMWKQVQQEQQAAEAKFTETSKQLQAKWVDTLPPEKQQRVLQEYAQSDADFDTIFKYGSMAAKGIIMAAAGGAAAGALSGTATAANAVGAAVPGEALASGSALSGAGSITAGGVGAGTGAGAGALTGVDAAMADLANAGGITGGDMAAGSSLSGLDAAAVDLANAGGITGGDMASTGALGSSSATVIEPAVKAAITQAANAGTPLTQLLSQYGPAVLKAALPLLAGAITQLTTGSGNDGGGGTGGTGTGPGSTTGGTYGTNTPGVMNGGVLGATGVMGTPWEQEAATDALAQTRTDWANRPNQTDMYGNSTTWSSEAVLDPATGQMVNKWTNKVTLSPQQQEALDSQTAVQTGRLNTAEGMNDQVANAFANPMDYSQFQDWGEVPEAGRGLQTGLNTGSLGDMPAADAAERQRIENMLFDRMAPQHQAAQAGLEARVAAMGLTRGSEQWNREMQRLGDQQSRERFNAMEIGGNEMVRLHGMGMANRNQGWEELLGSGNFANAAQQQGYTQGLGSANYANQLRGLQTDEEMRRRMQPLTEQNALMNGQTVGGPQFGRFSTSQTPGGVDYSAQYTSQQGVNQANNASTGAGWLNLATNAGTTLINNWPSANQPQPGVMNGGYNQQTGQQKTTAQGATY